MTIRLYEVKGLCNKKNKLNNTIFFSWFFFKCGICVLQTKVTQKDRASLSFDVTAIFK